MFPRDIDIIEARLATSFKDELTSIEKEAFNPIPWIRGAAKGLSKSKKLMGAGKALKKIPEKAWYRMTGRTFGEKGMKGKKLLKHRTKRTRDLGVEGAEGKTKGLRGRAKEILEKDPGFFEKHLGIGAKRRKELKGLAKAKGGVGRVRAADLEKALGSQGKQISAAAEAHGRGMTSLPGYAKSLAKNPLQTLKAGWQSEGRTGKLMAGGFGGMGAYNVATAPPGERLKTLAEEVPAQALYMAAGPLGFVPQMLAAEGAATGAGKLVGALSRKKPPVPGAVAKPPMPGALAKPPLPAGPGMLQKPPMAKPAPGALLPPPRPLGKV